VSQAFGGGSYAHARPATTIPEESLSGSDAFSAAFNGAIGAGQAGVQASMDPPQLAQPPPNAPRAYKPKSLYGADVTAQDENMDEKVKYEKQQAIEDLTQMGVTHNFTLDSKLEDIEFARGFNIRRQTMRANVNLGKTLVLKGGAALLEFGNRKFLGDALPIKGLRKAVAEEVNKGVFDGPLERYCAKHFRSGRMEPESELLWGLGGVVGSLVLTNLMGDASKGLLGGPSSSGAADAAQKDASLRGDTATPQAQSQGADMPAAQTMAAPDDLNGVASTPFERPQKLPASSAAAAVPSKHATEAKRNADADADAADADANAKQMALAQQMQTISQQLSQKEQGLRVYESRLDERRRASQLEHERRELEFTERIRAAERQFNERATKLAEAETMLRQRAMQTQRPREPPSPTSQAPSQVQERTVVLQPPFQRRKRRRQEQASPAVESKSQADSDSESAQGSVDCAATAETEEEDENETTPPQAPSSVRSRRSTKSSSGKPREADMTLEI